MYSSSRCDQGNDTRTQELEHLNCRSSDHMTLKYGGSSRKPMPLPLPTPTPTPRTRYEDRLSELASGTGGGSGVANGGGGGGETNFGNGMIHAVENGHKKSSRNGHAAADARANSGNNIRGGLDNATEHPADEASVDLYHLSPSSSEDSSEDSVGADASSAESSPPRPRSAAAATSSSEAPCKNPKPPPAVGSGLVEACGLVRRLWDQVSLHDCPPDNEDEGLAAPDGGGGGATSMGAYSSAETHGTAAEVTKGWGGAKGGRYVRDSPPKIGGRKGDYSVHYGSSRSSNGGLPPNSPRRMGGSGSSSGSGSSRAGYRVSEQPPQGFSRQRHVVPASLHHLYGEGARLARGHGTSGSFVGVASSTTPGAAASINTNRFGVGQHSNAMAHPSSSADRHRMLTSPTASAATTLTVSSMDPADTDGGVTSPLSMDPMDHYQPSSRTDAVVDALGLGLYCGEGGDGDVLPAKTWESDQGSLLALIRLKSSDSMDEDVEEGEEVEDNDDGRYGMEISPTSYDDEDDKMEMAPGTGSTLSSVVAVAPISATTAPLLAGYTCTYAPLASSAMMGSYSATALRKMESRMGTASLAALCARTLDTVAGAGPADGAAEGGVENTPKRVGGKRPLDGPEAARDAVRKGNGYDDSDGGDVDEVDMPPLLDRKTTSASERGVGGLLEDCVNTIFSTDDDDDEDENNSAASPPASNGQILSPPPPPLPPPPAAAPSATPPAVQPSPRRLTMFGSEYARHLSSTPFSPPEPKGSLGRLPKSSKKKKKSRLDKFSRPTVPGGIHPLPSKPSTPGPPAASIDDVSPFSPEIPVPLTQKGSNLSSLSGSSSPMKPASTSRPPIGGAATLPKDPLAIENQSPEILTGAITDIVVTVGNERPPKGYFRISQSSSGLDLSTMKRAKTGKTSSVARSGKSALTQLSRKPVALYLNVKKEANWDRAVQRPCVTAITIIYPDRNEFVPPGFCVVRRSKSGKGDDGNGEGTTSRKKRGTSSSMAASIASGGPGETLPANLNMGSISGERVYLCYRRSREGNPLTAILPLAPAAQESVPEGYTVLERTPRNFVADINQGAGPALFLAYRQRLANLEPLRPLPLILAVYYSNLQSKGKAQGGVPDAASALDKARGKVGSDGEVIWERRLHAYFCTGGTVVPSDVGRFHVMDRSTHPLLSPSSVTNRLTLIEASRKKAAAEKGGSSIGTETPVSPSSATGNASASTAYSSPAVSNSGRYRPNKSFTQSSYSPVLDRCISRGISLLDARSNCIDTNGSFYTDEGSVISSSASAHSASRPKAISWNSSHCSGADSPSLHNINNLRLSSPSFRAGPMPSPYDSKSMFGDDDESNGGMKLGHESALGADIFSYKGPERPRVPKARNIFTHPDPAMQACFDAMSFIPTIDCPAMSESSGTAQAKEAATGLLQARTSIITPILTACYTQHGGAALMAVDGLIYLLNETDFFVPDVAGGVSRQETECSTSLTLLDLAVQVVCDCATSSSRETSFVTCVEFVGDALRFSGGTLNARTLGCVLRFYLFVFYFGASIPTPGTWPNDEICDCGQRKGVKAQGSTLYSEKMSDSLLLAENDTPSNIDISNGGLASLRSKRGYLTGGAPQAAALALKDLITLLVGRMRTMNPGERSDILKLAMSDFDTMKSDLSRGAGRAHSAPVMTESIGMFISDMVYNIVDGAMDRVEMTNFTQLALHQIHRSGGSELFWHDMMTSCGVGLFGSIDAAGESKFRYVISFALLASLVKVSSGKVRRVGETSKLVPRDIASKMLSLELLLHYLERWRDMAAAENIKKAAANDEDWNPRTGQPYDPNKDNPAIATMAYAIRRLVVACLLSNTGAGLENRRVFRRVVSIVSELWCHPYHRHNLKLELGVLFEHFFIKLLRLGPQVLPPKRLKELGRRLRGNRSYSPLLEDFTSSLLSQQLDVLTEIKCCFSGDPKDVLELFLNFDVADVRSNVPMLPGSYWKITQRLCESLCDLAEEAGNIISETIRATHINGIGEAGASRSSSSAAALSSAVIASADFAEMTHMREGARLVQQKAFEALSQIVKCFMQCAALTSGDRYERIKGSKRISHHHQGVLSNSVDLAFAGGADTPPRKTTAQLTIDTSRPIDDDSRSMASTIRDDESTVRDSNAGGKLGWRHVPGISSSPLRMSRSTRTGKSPLRPSAHKHFHPSPSRPLDSTTSTDMVEYWQTSLAERRRIIMSPGDHHHMSNFASPDIRITPMGGGSAKGVKVPRKPILPPIPQTPAIANSNRLPSMRTVKEKAPTRTKTTDSEQSCNRETQKTEETLQVALEIMSTKGVKKAIEYLIACHFIAPSARDVASFLRLHQAQINAEALGDYLGEGGIDGADAEYWNLIRFNYVRAISFVGLNVEQGLRHFLTSCGFRLPGEAQKIDRIISTFSQCYWEDNAGDSIRCPFQDQDTVFLISFAIIMLNTDLHSTGVSGTSGSFRKQRKKMTKSEFLNNLRGVESSEDLSRDYLSAVYDSIEAHAIEIYITPASSRPSGSVRSCNTVGSSTKGSSFLPSVSSQRPGDVSNEDLASMISSLLRSVKPAEELLRGVAVHRHPFLTIADYGHTYQNGPLSVIPRELVRNAVGNTWHHFHGIVNSAIESAHVDSKGLEFCLDVLKYSLCATICLDMPMERDAFVTQLARVKIFNDGKIIKDDDDVAENHKRDQQAYRDEEWCKDLERHCANDSTDESKDAAVQMVYNMIKDTHASLQIDSKLRRDMKRVARRIRKGELLLNDPSRSFVKEGDLIKRNNSSGRNVKYHFFLFSDVLVYTHKSSAGDYKIHEELPLHMLKVTDKFTGAARKTNRAFHIRHPTKSFMVFASDAVSKNDWMTAIHDAVSKDVERKARLEGARLASAAVER